MLTANLPYLLATSENFGQYFLEQQPVKGKDYFISIATERNERIRTPIDSATLYLEFYDTGNPSVLGGFGNGQAAKTAEFIRAVKAKQANLWVNCQAGISRSGAIVDILIRLGWEDLKSPLQEKRHPNPIVWHKLISHFPELNGSQYPFKDYQDWHDQTMDYMYSKWGNKKT